MDKELNKTKSELSLTGTISHTISNTNSTGGSSNSNNGVSCTNNNNCTGTNIKNMNINMEFQFIKHVVKGVKAIHKHGFVHRDLKPENCFIDLNNCQLKIGDFGLIKRY